MISALVLSCILVSSIIILSKFDANNHSSLAVLNKFTESFCDRIIYYCSDFDVNCSGNFNENNDLVITCNTGAGSQTIKLLEYSVIGTTFVQGKLNRNNNFSECEFLLI